MLSLPLMDDPFDSAWLKWAWGVVDAKVLEDQINTLRGQHDADLPRPMVYGHEYHPKRHCIIVTLEAIEGELFPKFWGALLGNLVNNFRSALDHVAWAIYKRGHTPNLPDWREGKVYFPISDTRTGFNDSLKTKLPGARRADIALVRRYQPYHGGKRNLERHVLRTLNELSRLDKHRSIQPVVPVPETTAWTIKRTEDCIFRSISPSTPRVTLEPGAELVRLYVKKTGPNPYIDMEPRFTVDPAISSRLGLGEFMTKSMEGVMRIIGLFAEMPDFAREIARTPPTQPDVPAK